MELIWLGLIEAYRLIVTLDPMVMAAAVRTIVISTLAVTLSTLVGLPIGTLLGRAQFPGRHLIVMACRGGMAVPTVFIGIVCYGLFSRRGPMGPLQLLFTPWVIVAGEFILALPIVLSITQGAVKALDRRVGETALTLGAGPFRRWRTYIGEARVGVTLGILTAFARCVTELGIAMMVGGDIPNRTRTLATATALETRKGNFGQGMAVGLILVAVALLVTVAIVQLSQADKE